MVITSYLTLNTILTLKSGVLISSTLWICSLKSPSLGLPSSELLNFRENRVFCMHCDDGRTNRWTGLLRTRTNLDYYSTSNNSKTVADRAIFTMAATNRKSYYGLSNGAIFNDLGQPLTQFSRLLYSLTLNILP